VKSPFLLIVGILALLIGSEPDLSNLRRLFQLSATRQDAAKQLNELLARVDTNAAPLMVCYKGASEMMQAKYAFSPVVKLRKFNAGKVLMEKAIARDSLNLEMRFLRFSIQCNLPSFLGYHDQEVVDKVLIINNINEVNDLELRAMVTRWIKSSDCLTLDELNKFKN
jgi:hypothetical protein